MPEFLTHPWYITASAGASFACIVFLVLDAWFRAREAHRRAMQEILVTETTSGFLRSLLPIARGIGMAIRILLSRGRSTSLYMQWREGIARAISAAGTPQGLNADEFVGFGILFAAGGGLFGILLFLLLEPDAIFSIYVWFLGCGFLGAYLWRLWLVRKMTERQTAIRKVLPFALDLMTLAMEAGLDFTAAMGRIAKKIAGTPLGREFSLTLHEIQLGKTRSQALRDLANRIDITEVRTVVASLIQAEELGSSLGPVLRLQAAQQRERRSQRAEEEAMKAPVKMLFPLVVFIFPTTLIMIFAPLVMMFMGYA